MDNHLNLRNWQKWGLLVLSFFIVAFGQPAWNEWLPLVASVGGFACFWRVLLDVPSGKKRFLIGFGWFTAVQCVQLSWFLSHPYLYIYGVTLLCACIMGLQWGIISIGIKLQNFSRLTFFFSLAGLWTLFEWSRLFLLTGLPFNPVGLTLSGTLYPLQLASIGGIYGLSFWVILTNLLFLSAWLQPSNLLKSTSFALVALFPYLFGWGHFYFHEDALKKDPRTIEVVLVQSALPIEENMGFQSALEARQFVLDEWYQVLATLRKQVGQKNDLIVFPEYLVPYGTFHHIFPMEEIHQLFQQLFGNASFAYPSQASSFADLYWIDNRAQWFVSNAYLAQTIANIFQAHVVIGFEDSTYENEVKSHSYSSAFHFIPDSDQLPQRYEKRVLVPMGEYIPFSWCRKLAAKYGVTGSLSCGTCAKVFKGPVPFGASICYEEMYGHLMRENRQCGAELLVNLTNDGWYPQSLLPKQHFDHARLRTVENGIPLIRACNTGITAALDSLGQVIGILGENHMRTQTLSDSIRLSVPLYHYQTIYSGYGDFPVLILSGFFVFIGLRRKREI